MHYLKTIVGISLLFMVAVCPINAQTPEAVIVIEAWSPQELHDLGWTTHASTGLSVVGMEEQVYLFVKEASGEAITSVTWSLTGIPAGSAVTLDSTDTQRTTFVPDTTGQFEVQAEIVTTGGAATASVTITAGKYVGVGTVGGATPNTGAGQCGQCHSGNEVSWSATGHATMFTEAIDGLKSSHYNENCIECHTVGYFQNVRNGGFWDVQQQVGWTFPDSLVPGNWDNIVTNFPSLAAVSNIQCENCHGPGSLHLGDKSKIEVSLDEGVCGRCHEEEPYHVKNIQWANSAHAKGETFARGTSSTCAPCHSGWGLIARLDPASDLELKTGNQNISCAVCHDPHDATNAHQLRLPDEVILASGPALTFGGTGQLCMACHKDRREGGGEQYASEFHSPYRGPHHSNQTDMLAGVREAVITFGRVLPNSTHKDVVENACVGCHMGSNQRDDLGDHSWAMHTTEIAGTDTTTFDHVEPCRACHDPNMTSFDDMLARADHDGDGTIEAAQAEIEGLLHDVGMMLPPFDSPDVDISSDVWYEDGNLLLRKAGWNYFFVDYDHSHGVHNYQFSVALLQLTKDALTYGVLSEGEITNVEDVPNDQGKQVRVVWTRFGGDGNSDNPVRNYAIWRKVEDTSVTASKGALNTLNISAEHVASLELGTDLTIEGELWDFVGEVPAATMEEYSAVVSTLFDSTASGLKLSTFRVSGHTNLTAVYAMTQPASGYSIDNLNPAAPSSLAGVETEAGVALTWDEPVDEDFDFFALYRGTTAGFDPAEPIAELTDNAYVDSDVAIGTTYFYRLAAVDFSENRSALSQEFSLLVTSVDQTGGVLPQNYALEQNYPNPFNPSTTIRFAVKESGHVQLTLYDALGKEVLKAVDTQLPAGSHNVVIDASRLSTGVYFYRLQVNSFKAVKKMLLVK